MRFKVAMAFALIGASFRAATSFFAPYFTLGVNALRSGRFRLVDVVDGRVLSMGIITITSVALAPLIRVITFHVRQGNRVCCDRNAGDLRA
jgi:hypothetical protein